MAKFARVSKLSKEKTHAIIVRLCQAIASMKNGQEAAQLLTDLLGKQELEMISKRLMIAELLLEGETYKAIIKETATSSTTIARVQAWLLDAGAGYRLVSERLDKRTEKTNKLPDEPFGTSWLKRKYPLYYWPQIVLEHWVEHANAKEKKQMKEILEKVGAKHQLYKQIHRLL